MDASITLFLILLIIKLKNYILYFLFDLAAVNNFLIIFNEIGKLNAIHRMIRFHTNFRFDHINFKSISFFRH